MSPEFAAVFRSTFRLHDLVGLENPEVTFRALARMAAWVELQKARPSPDHDRLFSGMQESVTLWQSLPLYFAPIDRQFFLRARRMAAATMWREDRFSARYRDMAALLLLLDPPKSTRPKATFDALFVMGMAVGQQLFSHPTEGPESKRNPGSSAAMKFMGEVVELAPHQHREPSTPPAIWKKRREKLMAVGFREYEVLEFFDLTFPAKQMG